MGVSDTGVREVNEGGMKGKRRKRGERLRKESDTEREEKRRGEREREVRGA